MFEVHALENIYTEQMADKFVSFNEYVTKQKKFIIFVTNIRQSQ